MVEQSSGLFICEPFNQLVTLLPTVSTLKALEPGEHVETSDGKYPHDIFPFEYGYIDRFTFLNLTMHWVQLHRRFGGSI